MYLPNTLLPLVLAIASVVIVVITYIWWAFERARGNKPLPILSRILRRIFPNG